MPMIAETNDVRITAFIMRGILLGVFKSMTHDVPIKTKMRAIFKSSKIPSHILMAAIRDIADMTI